jgi:uncharacterized protein (DUF3084 family)
MGGLEEDGLERAAIGEGKRRAASSERRAARDEQRAARDEQRAASDEQRAARESGFGRKPVPAGKGY